MGSKGRGGKGRGGEEGKGEMRKVKSVYLTIVIHMRMLPQLYTHLTSKDL